MASDKRQEKYTNLQEQLFKTWADLRNQSLEAVTSYNARRESLSKALDEEAVLLKQAIELCNQDIVTIQQKKLNLEADFKAVKRPFPEVDKSVNDIISKACVSLGKLTAGSDNVVSGEFGAAAQETLLKEPDLEEDEPEELS